MGYSVDNVIDINVSIQPSGLGLANFASAMLFAPAAELPNGFAVDTIRVYNSTTDLGVDFGSTTETYKAGVKWLGAIPSVGKLTVYAVNATDANWTATLNKARNSYWWYWSLFTVAEYSVEATVLTIADWCNQNSSFFINNQTGTSATAIRDPSITNDIATQLTTLGYRYAATFTHATDAYAGNSLAPWYAVVNYSASNSTITGEDKKLSGIAAESLTSTEYAAMTSDTKKCVFYSVVDLQGSVDEGRVINTITHSTYGEFIDDVVNLDAFVNALKVKLYNTITNQDTKLPQTPAGQSALITGAKIVGGNYVKNDYLGAREYLDPDDGKLKTTIGYEVLSKATDILSISDADRAARKSAPIRMRIFKSGAIHIVNINLTVF